MTVRRVAFFTDSFHEVNGVALTSRELVDCARRRSIPLLSVHAGPRNRVYEQGSVTTVEFERGAVRWNLEHDLAIDLMFWRHRKRLRAALLDFRPDLVHITGPGDAGILGAQLAYEFRVPLAASWHTNLHEFGGRRLASLLRFLPDSIRSRAVQWAERRALDQCVRFYRLAKVLFAPNPELVRMLAQRTGRPTFLMTRGIDASLFSPKRRVETGSPFVIGYVGRLSPEKNVRLLADIEKLLIESGSADHRFLVVGEGSERDWLRRTLRNADLPGVLRGEELARAYASMDVFVFPSCTDTFGNVVLEAMASGVPALVMSAGGPKFLVDSGGNGYVVTGVRGFVAAITKLRRDPQHLAEMRSHARESAERFSWDAVCEGMYQRYSACFAGPTTGAGATANSRCNEAVVHAQV